MSVILFVDNSFGKNFQNFNQTENKKIKLVEHIKVFTPASVCLLVFVLYYELLSQPAEKVSNLNSKASAINRFLHIIYYDVLGHKGGEVYALNSAGKIEKKIINSRGLGKIYYAGKKIIQLIGVPIALYLFSDIYKGLIECSFDIACLQLS